MSVSDRTELVRAALDGQRLERIPAIGDASHVAVALLAHFYGSPAANDLCYKAQIGRSSCRPLSASPRKPLPMIKLRER